MTVYIYPGTITAVHDGDSLTAALDLFRWPLVSTTVELRLNGINARELAQPGGPEARDHLTALAPPGTPVTVTVRGPDKYGNRLDANIRLLNGLDVAQAMIDAGYAAAWNGTGPKPVPPWPIPTPAGAA